MSDRAAERCRERLLQAAEALADAAEKLGKCHSADAARPEHYKVCARCAVKTAVKQYREACQ